MFHEIYKQISLGLFLTSTAWFSPGPPALLESISRPPQRGHSSESYRLKTNLGPIHPGRIGAGQGDAATVFEGISAEARRDCASPGPREHIFTVSLFCPLFMTGSLQPSPLLAYAATNHQNAAKNSTNLTVCSAHCNKRMPTEHTIIRACLLSTLLLSRAQPSTLL